MKLNDDIIEAYLKGRLSAEEAKRVEAHLDALIRLGAPEVPSQRMWKGIQAKLAQPAPLELPAPSLWERLSAAFARPQGWAMAGAGMAALALGVNLYFKAPEAGGVRPPSGVPGPAEGPAQPTPAAKRRPVAEPAAEAAGKKMAAAPAAGGVRAPGASFAPEMPAVAEAAPAPRRGMTEVERALADQDLDNVVASLLLQQQNLRRSGGARARADSGATPVSYGAPMAAASMAMDEASAPARLGGVNEDGFWDFEPAAVAMNQRRWDAAAAEFRRAEASAPDAAERAFAASALQLLGKHGVIEPGQGSAEELLVQSAGRWQYFAAQRVARYSEVVVARMPGLRSEGPSLQLDLTFDRASFAPGTRFTRLAGGSPAKAEGFEGQNSFAAPRGADYLLRARELRVK